MDNLLIKIEENAVVAARRHHEAGSIDLAVLIAVFAQVEDAVVVFILTRIKNEVGVQILTLEQYAVTVGVFGVVFERRAELVIDGRRSKQLQRRVDDGSRLGNHEGIDVDLNIFSNYHHDARINAHQRGRLNAGLGRDEFRSELV